MATAKKASATQDSEQDTGAAGATGGSQDEPTTDSAGNPDALTASADAKIGAKNAEGTPLKHAAKPDPDSKALSPAAAEADVEGTGVDLTDTILAGAVPAPSVAVEAPSGPRDATPRILGVYKPGDGRRYHPGDEAALQKDGLSSAQIAAGRREGTLAGAWNPVLDDPNYDPSQPDGAQGAGGRLTTADLAKDPSAGNPTAKDAAISQHAAKGGSSASFAAETGAEPEAGSASAKSASKTATKSASKSGAKSAAKKGASAKKGR